MINTVIILGEHIQALGLARQAHAHGLRVILALKNRCCVARFSNTVDSYFHYSDEESLTQHLLVYKDSHTLLFPSSDDMIEYLDNHRVDFEGFFTVGIPDKNCIRVFANKRNTYRFCEKEGIPHPKSYYPNTIEEANDIAGRIEYPAIIKPAVMYRFHALTKKKAILCRDKDDLVEKLNELIKTIPIEELLIQEFLRGGAPSLYSYGTFAVNGEPKCWIMANRIRQNPMDFGNSTTFAVTCNIPEIEDSARKILKLTNYTGLAEVEFMFDDKEGVFKFLEINTRAWKWHSISQENGFGFFSEMLHFLNGMNVKFESKRRTVAWVEMLSDIYIIIKEVLRGRMHLREALISYRIPKTHAVWDREDPLPAVMYVLLSPVLFFIRQ